MARAPREGGGAGGAHPLVVLFHVGWKVAALATYLTAAVLCCPRAIRGDHSASQATEVVS